MIGGGQTVTIKSAQSISVDRKNIPVTTYVSATWAGVSLQPTEVRETVTNIDYEINKFKVVGPPTAAALALKTTDLIIDANNVAYRVIATKVPPRINGAPHHVQALLETPSGLN